MVKNKLNISLIILTLFIVMSITACNSTTPVEPNITQTSPSVPGGLSTTPSSSDLPHPWELLNCTVQNVRLIEATSTTVKIEATIQIDNQNDVKVNINSVGFHAHCLDDNGKRLCLGGGSKTDFSIQPKKLITEKITAELRSDGTDLADYIDRGGLLHTKLFDLSIVFMVEGNYRLMVTAPQSEYETILKK